MLAIHSFFQKAREKFEELKLEGEFIGLDVFGDPKNPAAYFIHGSKEDVKITEWKGFSSSWEGVVRTVIHQEPL